jgi:hypothetical protein
LNPYLATIAGVVTTGVAAFAARFGWRWLAAPKPFRLSVFVDQETFRVTNRCDFTVSVLAMEAPSPPGDDAWRHELEEPHRLASQEWFEVARQDLTSAPFRVDRPYRVEVRDDHFVGLLTHARNCEWRSGSPERQARRWMRSGVQQVSVVRRSRRCCAATRTETRTETSSRRTRWFGWRLGETA